MVWAKFAHGSCTHSDCISLSILHHHCLAPLLISCWWHCLSYDWWSPAHLWQYLSGLKFSLTWGCKPQQVLLFIKSLWLYLCYCRNFNASNSMCLKSMISASIFSVSPGLCKKIEIIRLWNILVFLKWDPRILAIEAFYAILLNTKFKIIVYCLIK